MPEVGAGNAMQAPRGASRAIARFVISTVCLSGTLEDKLRAAAAGGFNGIEILESDLVMSPWSPQRIRHEAAKFGLSIDAYQPLHVEAVPPDLFEASLRRAERKFDVLEGLGADVMLICSSKSPHGVDDDDLAAEQLHELATVPSAAGCGSRTNPFRGDACVRTTTRGASSNVPTTRRSGCASTASTFSPSVTTPPVSDGYRAPGCSTSSSPMPHD